jgi:hypothetical protein
LAFETVVADDVFGGGVAGRDFGDAQHVAAGWADCGSVMLVGGRGG